MNEEQSIVNAAGFWVRLGAGILDSLIVFLPLTLIVTLTLGEAIGENFSNILSVLYSMILPVVWYGYTVGKRILGIRIVKLNGEKVGFGAMFMRTIIASIVYVITLGIGLIVSAFMVGLRKDRRSIHDFIAGTYVTYEKPAEI